MEKMRIQLVRTNDDSYDIIFGRNLFPKIAEDLAKSKLGDKYAIITDSNVKSLHGDRLKKVLGRAGIKSNIFYFKPGEQRKKLHICEAIIEKMTEKKYTRDCAVLALGGGVIGDMAGFIAAIFLRGIPFIQIPTTILAQADASIGGKTGCDLQKGKNLVGAFYQPKAVYQDIDTLVTLPRIEISYGLSETNKHATILNEDFFDWLEDNVDKVLAKDEEALLYIAKKNCELKGKVVMEDVHEKNYRRILNFGHTIGHAIEVLSGYKKPHGECVSIGMMAAARIAQEVTGFPESDVKKLRDLLIKSGLPVKIPAEMSVDAIMEAAKTDKKAKGGRPRYCLPEKIGKMAEFDGVYATYVSDEIVKKALRESR